MSNSQNGKKTEIKTDIEELPPKTNKPFYQAVKRIIDIVVAVIVLIIFSPLLIITSIAIYLEDGESPIFTKTRLGKHKEPFTFYKFRSMVVNAFELEREDEELYEQLRSGEHKVESHPHVTRVGKFIRKYSIDEFPQFISVLKGEMSVVGPRALYPDEREKFIEEHPEYKEYLEVLYEAKPGITGYWQVSGRSNIPFVERIKMEAKYVRTRSILSDIIIMLKTPLAVLRAETH